MLCILALNSGSCCQALRWFIQLLLAIAAVSHGLPGTFVAAPDEDANEGWHSQYGQDRLIMNLLYGTERADAKMAVQQGKPFRQGVFIELGAADGKDKSNTLAFERKLGWTGLLIEPVPSLYDILRRNRPNSACSQDCVAGDSGYYYLAEDGYSSGMTDRHIREAQDSVVKRKCRMLGDLIDQHLGPQGAHIDYLSLDTEGTELDILRSFDFKKHVVDVISIEVDDVLAQEKYEHLAKLLLNRGYRFLERLVVDEIWIRQRGLFSDPSCFLPLLNADAPIVNGKPSPETPVPRGGWGNVRNALRKLFRWMSVEPFGDTEGKDWTSVIPMAEQGNADHVSVMMDIMTSWNTEDLLEWEGQCPAGMLTLALTDALVHNRQTGDFKDVVGLSNELRKHMLFHWSNRVLGIVQVYEHQKEVKAAEDDGVGFEVRLPLGRLWHETSFVEILEGQWPFFGLLDQISKHQARMGHAYEHMKMKGGTVEMRPVRLPDLRCQLELSKSGEEPPRLVLLRPTPRRGKRKAISELMLSTDTCGLLGVAAGHFHKARAELRRLIKHESSNDLEYYQPLANWTAGCQGQQHSVTNQACSSTSFHECAAIADNNRRVPRDCLHLRYSASAGIRVRRKHRIAKTRVFDWIEEGERLFREFVNKHGLYPAVWASSRQELAPARDGKKSKPTGFPMAEELVQRDTMFAVLQSIQEELNTDEY
eukprot:TRINITY_DN8833_c0_g1_i1.p1 TRINITY_DN8833_c0_g1~~TRINITY_DN8833_c0_g1_i1.p1  ORF type:complete len:705 (+),score=114.41 TRINITY_DN8833_c0_g1_i1:117-2231(+)